MELQERAGVRLGLVTPNTGTFAVESVMAMPQFAEELGFSSVWVTDHVIGVKAFEPMYGPIWMEALTSLAYMAATTTRVRLGVGVLVMPYRNPVYTAKVLSTIDNLSNGRLILGAGTGWSRSEYNILGRGDVFEKRGAATDETLALIKHCWAGGEMGWQGEFNNFRSMEFAPVPVQKPGVPIWVGGFTKPALRRAAKFADAWHPPGDVKPEDIPVLGAEIDAMAGRSVMRTIRILVKPGTASGDLADLVKRYRDAGCVDVVLEFKDDTLDAIRRGAEGLVAAMSK